jgi:hypothetical protein
MNVRQFHRLLIAPEMIVVHLALATLVALERALRVEHPLVDDPLCEQPPIRRRARAVLRQADRLRTALRRYQQLVRSIAREAQQPDFPF